jgi:hypothetical protein
MEKITVRVRILVAVDCKGKWIACGSSDHSAKEIIFIDNLEDGEIYHWVEADVPLPAEAGPAIEGIVHAG